MRYTKILLVLITILIIAILFTNKIQIQIQQPNKTDNDTIINRTDNNINRTDNNATINRTDNTIFISNNVCEGCHLSGKSSVPQALNVKPHTNGGFYCLTCHNFSHDKHPINKNVTCEKCHEGKNPTKPVFINGSIVCNNCHNYPNPLEPSYGNIITIHRPRDVSCITCHADRCTKCHAEMGTSERWEKRLNHFRVILSINS